MVIIALDVKSWSGFSYWSSIHLKFQIGKMIDSSQRCELFQDAVIYCEYVVNHFYRIVDVIYICQSVSQSANKLTSVFLNTMSAKYSRTTERSRDFFMIISGLPLICGFRLKREMIAVIILRFR